MICRVVHDVLKDFRAAHGAPAAADESDLKDFTSLLGLQGLGIVEIPIVDRSLIGLQLIEGRAVIRISGRKAMRCSLQVRLPDHVHDIDVVERSEDAAEDDGLWFDQHGIWQFRQRPKQSVIGPRLVAQKFREWIAVGHVGLLVFERVAFFIGFASAVAYRRKWRLLCSMRQMDESKHCATIAIVAYPGVQMSAVLGLADLFTVANSYADEDGSAQLAVRQVTEQEVSDPASGRFDAIVLPPTLDHAERSESSAIHGWLRDQHGAGALMCSACAGLFWLGHSGLLEGRAVTTHWTHEDAFRARFPDAQLNLDYLLVDDNDIVTVGGLMAWLDLGLHIVKRWLGPQVAAATERHLLIDPDGRTQHSYRNFRPPLAHGDEAILTLQHWLEGHTGDDITVQGMAQRVRLSGRTFLRRFKAATGQTPTVYLRNLRVEKARGLLERTLIPISEIAWNVGYRDASAFARAFRTTTGLTAGAYRTRFGVAAREAQGSP